MAERTSPVSGPVFDRALLALRRARARRMNVAGADFLVRRAAEEIGDRLAATNRDFARAIDLMTPSPALREMIAAARPGIAMETVDDCGADGGLGLAGGEFDLAVSAFGLHRVDDLPGALAQIRRALKPDGLFMAALPGEGTLAELRQAAIAAETAVSGGAAMRVDPFPELRSLGALLQRAGFALPVADVEKLELRYRDVASLVRDLRAMGATSTLADRAPALPKAFAARLEQEYAERYASPDGRIAAGFNIVFLTGWAPHESQQRPLRPGTALQSLEKALKR